MNSWYQITIVAVGIIGVIAFLTQGIVGILETIVVVLVMSFIYRKLGRL